MTIFILVWTIGVMFTGGIYFGYKDECPDGLLSLVLCFLWPVFLGVIVGSFLTTLDKHQ